MTAVYAIIPAAGRGARFSTEAAETVVPRNKVFADLCGRPILCWTASAFADHPEVDRIIIVAASGEIDACVEAVRGIAKIFAVVPGGSSRQDSVRAALERIQEDDAVVMVHDAARPLVSPDIIDRCLASVMEHGNGVAGIPVADTLKSVSEEGVATATIDRSGLWAMQTPQAFRIQDLTAGYAAAAAAGFAGTDEASLVALLPDQSVRIVLGSPDNFKITRGEDLRLAEAVVRARSGEKASMRIGFGYDIHPFSAGRRIFLGGVEFDPVDGRGLDGHSDADVLLHAIADALLGAAALPDIGRLFPNTDSRYKGISSLLLLAEVRDRIRALGYSIANVDATVIAEKPRIAGRVDEMRAAIAVALGLDSDRIGIKATTNEGIGALGNGEGIAAHAVACLMRD